MATEITRSRIDWLSDLITAADDAWMAADGLDLEITIATDHNYEGRSRVTISMMEVTHNDAQTES